VFRASRAATGGNFGSAFGSTTRCSAAGSIDDQRSGANRTSSTSAAASLEVRRTNNLTGIVPMKKQTQDYEVMFLRSRPIMEWNVTFPFRRVFL
jgi:hypothetical protein